MFYNEQEEDNWEAGLLVEGKLVSLGLTSGCCVLVMKERRESESEGFMEKPDRTRTELCLRCICPGLGVTGTVRAVLAALGPSLHGSYLLAGTAVEGDRDCFLSVVFSVQTGSGACCPHSRLQVSVRLSPLLSPGRIFGPAQNIYKTLGSCQ